jgi:hypothetical protein
MAASAKVIRKNKLAGEKKSKKEYACLRQQATRERKRYVNFFLID